ncbi:MAG TPA: DoxX family protein [Cytophagaceae bacterium]|jgi:hypothetical protein|nr:DoxX family protein [Cytophagaceae bacterium]
MKAQKITYWITTGIFSAMMLLSAFMYLTSDEIKANFIKIGFPSFFRVELAVAKFIGALVLLVPMIPSRIKEWAYAGFGITLVSAFIAHTSIGDPAGACIMPLVMFVVLATSYITYHRLNGNKL